ncbi:MAG: hypothetical protein F4047_05615 [Caldilineaceae bacterium SB0670_bin_27]|nr:hypothetical protein [Chloroflexota bacterium]MYF65012.1 hypothetical protein [Chloroflexota bacterium]MYJ77629.1 hypothetical protein [Caldilineaceae bacterium SB0670_bin_27]
MIEGVVNAAYEAVITLPLQGPAGQTQEVEAVVDTGFNRFLTLPPEVVNELELHVDSGGDKSLYVAEPHNPYTAT